MNVAIIIFCFFLSGLFHQGLYVFFPFITLFFVSTQKNSRLELNPLSWIYLNIVLVVAGLLIIQALIHFEIRIFSIKGLLRFIAYFSFVVLISYMNKRDIKKFFICIVIYFVLTIPWGIFQLIQMGRYQNITGHSNHLAYVLAMCIYFLVFNKPIKDKGLNLVCIIGLFISLILTKSTGGLLVLASLIGYNALMTKRVSLIKKLNFITMLTLGILLGINLSDKIQYQVDSIDVINYEFIADRVTRYEINGVYRAGAHGSLVWRIVYWSKLVYTFLAESSATLLFGLGGDHLTKGYMPYDFMNKDPHNDFVKVLMEYGFIGLFLFIGLLRKIYKVINKNFNIFILMVVPMIFGNAIVNYTVNVTLILILVYEFKKNLTITN